jgi:hypothetical protein
MLYVLLYELVGVIMIFGTSAIHICRAMKKGYPVLECLNEKHEEIFGSPTKLDYIIGLVVWPIRYIRFLCSIPYLYELYKQYELNN